MHEWNEHELGRAASANIAPRHRRYRLLFHDTHHRAVTAPEAMAAYDLTPLRWRAGLRKVLRELYLERGWTARLDLA